MDETIYRLLLEKLAQSGLPDTSQLLVLAGCEGEEHLTSVIEGTSRPKRPEIPSEPLAEPVGAFLESITVEGFRGIGPPATLRLPPGPGLTLVVGRNGTGKSSFAEAIETLLTGDSMRWSQRRQVAWREGWRNLHHNPACIEATLVVEGEQGVRTVTRTWPDGAQLAGSTAVARSPTGQEGTIATLGWSDALVTFRPFLSYNELGSMLDEGPSKLFDALSSILGLEDLVEVERVVKAAHKRCKNTVDQAQSIARLLVTRLMAVDDDRARATVAAMSGRKWDLAAVEQQVLGADEGVPDTELALLRQLATLETPASTDVSAAVGGLRTAAAALTRVAGSDTDRARRVARLLTDALSLHRDHGDGDCPVCGRAGALDPAWRDQATAEARELEALAEESADARRQAHEARRSAEGLLIGVPPALQRAGSLGLQADDAIAAWKRWASAHEAHDAGVLAEHMEHSHASFSEAVERLRRAARIELDRREDAWRPVVGDVAAWLSIGRDAEEGRSQLPGLKAAEAWLKEAVKDLRAKRFDPIAAEATRIWELLRTTSSVSLGKVQLTGSGTSRRVALDVTVDDIEGVALGVMSQGELHSLALSLFLPRATTPESPFRFVVIDDPVQSMDPARVDGLARVLEETAARRQVVVFTHDDRLPASCRRLGIPATVIEVARRPGSVVETRVALDPVERYLDDARAVVRTQELAAATIARLVGGFCRLAIEAAAGEVVLRRRLARGEPHEQVERALSDIKVTEVVSLALFDDGKRGGEVIRTLNNRFGGRAADAYKLSKAGAHEAVVPAAWMNLVDDTAYLTRRLRTDELERARG